MFYKIIYFICILLIFFGFCFSPLVVEKTGHTPPRHPGKKPSFFFTFFLRDSFSPHYFFFFFFLEKMSDKKNCVLSGCLCCYSGFDIDNIILCCVGAGDCLCFRQACCCAGNVEPRGIGLVTNEDAGEICKIGCFCCDCGLIYPKSCCASASTCLCCYSVASFPCSDYYMKETVCAFYCLSCLPELGCCMPQQDCPALVDLREGKMDGMKE